MEPLQKKSILTPLYSFRYGYYVKRVEGLPFPTAEAQARLTGGGNGNRKRQPSISVMPAPTSIPGSIRDPQGLSGIYTDQVISQSGAVVSIDHTRLKTASPLTVATNSAVGSGSPLATPVPLPHSSPSASSAWSRRPIPAQSASSAPSSLFQVRNRFLLIFVVDHVW